jgi:hypothetical protein
MEGINTGNQCPNSSRLDVSSSPKDVSQNSPSCHAPSAALNNSIPDLGSIARRVATSSPDIREDAIQRAQHLLADPNWLSDDNLTSLASKISDLEDFQ